MPGEGSIFQRPDGQWMAQLSIGGKGNRRYIRRTRPTRREAAEALAELRGEVRAGVTRTRLLTSAYLGQWVRDARNIRETTRSGYRSVVTYHLVPTLGEKRLADLTPLDVEHALSVLSGRMSAKSLRNVHAVLRRALGQAVRAGLVSRNVASREFVDAPRVKLEEPRALTADEVHRLLDAAKGDRLEALFVVAIGTGLRQGELLGLAWENVELGEGHNDRRDTSPRGTRGSEGHRHDQRDDLRRSVAPDHRGHDAQRRGDGAAERRDSGVGGARLNVRRELTRRNGAYVRDEPKTDRSRRTVPLSPAVVAALREHRQRLIDAGFVPTATGPVFSNLRGEPLNGSWLTHHLYALCARAGIPRLPFKNLRSTFSSRLFEAGVPDRTIADLMGHSTVATTQRHYISTAGASQDAALEAVEALVG